MGGLTTMIPETMIMPDCRGRPTCLTEPAMFGDTLSWSPTVLAASRCSLDCRMQ
jgi:hypothetical protein